MKNKLFIYRALIILLCVFFALSGFLELTKNPATYPKTLQMGYPAYFITLLGIAKIAGAITLLLPGVKDLKEWAFAGFTFDIIFAFHSEYAIGSYSGCIKVGIAFVFLLIAYSLFKKLKNNILSVD